MKSGYRWGGNRRNSTSVNDLPDLTLASQVGGFGKYVFSCHNGHGNQAETRQAVSGLDGPFDITGPHTPGDLDY